VGAKWAGVRFEIFMFDAKAEATGEDASWRRMSLAEQMDATRNRQASY